MNHRNANDGNPDADQFEDRLVDTHEAARILGLSYRTLVNSRVYGGPSAIRFVKLNRSVRYSLRDLYMHIRSNTVTSTTDHYRAA